jgi:hypothetical protein
MVLLYRDQSMKDLSEMAGLEDFGHPGCEWNYWLAITGVDIFKQNDRQISSVSNNRIGGCRSQDWKTHVF